MVNVELPCGHSKDPDLLRYSIRFCEANQEPLIVTCRETHDPDKNDGNPLKFRWVMPGPCSECGQERTAYWKEVSRRPREPKQSETTTI